MANKESSYPKHILKISLVPIQKIKSWPEISLNSRNIISEYQEFVHVSKIK